MSRLNTLPSPNQRKDNVKMQQLIKQLMKVWSSKDVEENYQNYFLTYLDSLPQHIVELQISREIKKTLQNRSHYFNINKSLALHNTSVAKLKLAVQKVEKQQKIAEHELQYICELIDELRNNNILVAENTLNFNYESSTKSNNQFGFVHGNNYIFEKINTDHAFLKNSFLRKYIVFTNSYDPFFLHHYQTAKSTNDAKYKSLPCIEQLFNLSISKAYKAMKLQQEILSFMSGKVPLDRDQEKSKKPKRQSYNFIKDRNRYHTTIKEQQSEKQDSFRLQNRAYMKKLQTQPETPLLVRSKTDGQQINNYFQRSNNNSTYKKDRYQLPTIQRRQSFHTNDDRLNYSQIPNNPQFKHRIKRIQSISGEQDLSPITLNNANRIGTSSISLIRRRQDQFRNLLPLKYAKPSPINEQILKVQVAEIEDIRDQNDLHWEDPLENRAAKNIFSFQNSGVVQPFPQTRYRLPANVALMLKNFKLKAGNITVHSLFIFLKELNINQKYRNTFEVGNWQHSVRNNQYYLHKYYINQVLMAISLCCALPETDIVIKYWGPTKECDEEMSQFLFKKFLQHIERHTLCKVIYYNAVQIPEVFSNNFMRHKDRIYRRQRSMPIQIDYFSYYPFLSIDLSIISVPRSTSRDVQDNLVIPSNIYSFFTEKEFICLNYLLIVNKLINPGQFSNFGTFTPNLESMREVQTKMIKEQLNINPYNLDSKANPINLLTLRMRNPILSAFFIANKPLIKFTGEEVYRDNEASCIIVSLQMLKSNTRLYFGKGFKNLTDMITILKKNSRGYKKIEFCVHMFGKRMRGRIMSINLKDEVCYGDLQLVFQWKDFLKGKIQHNLQQYGTFGYNRQPFYCMVQVHDEHIFAFQVNQSNLI